METKCSVVANDYWNFEICQKLLAQKLGISKIITNPAAEYCTHLRVVSLLK